MFITERQAIIHFSVNGVQFGDTWATYTGGGLTATASKTRRGGMAREKSIGGPASRSDITMTIQQDDLVVGWHAFLEALVGRQDIVAKGAVQYLNPDRSVMTGALFARTGTLQSALLADVNHDSGAAGMYTVSIDADELMA